MHATNFILGCLLLMLMIPVAMGDKLKPPNGDLVIPRKEGGLSVDAMPAAFFPHWIHRARYRCDACHNDLFEMKLGATEISMELMRQGTSCGACHDGERAFKVGFDSCNRCHKPAVTYEKKKKKEVKPEDKTEEKTEEKTETKEVKTETKEEKK